MKRQIKKARACAIPFRLLADAGRVSQRCIAAKPPPCLYTQTAALLPKATVCTHLLSQYKNTLTLFLAQRKRAWSSEVPHVQDPGESSRSDITASALAGYYSPRLIRQRGRMVDPLFRYARKRVGGYLCTRRSSPRRKFAPLNPKETKIIVVIV